VRATRRIVRVRSSVMFLRSSVAQHCNVRTMQSVHSHQRLPDARMHTLQDAREIFTGSATRLFAGAHYRARAFTGCSFAPRATLA
jgi:hypothetical protein